MSLKTGQKSLKRASSSDFREIWGGGLFPFRSGGYTIGRECGRCTGAEQVFAQILGVAIFDGKVTQLPHEAGPFRVADVEPRECLGQDGVPVEHLAGALVFDGRDGMPENASGPEKKLEMRSAGGLQVERSAEALRPHVVQGIIRQLDAFDDVAEFIKDLGALEIDLGGLLRFGRGMITNSRDATRIARLRGSGR